MSRMKTVELGTLISEYSSRNKMLECEDVYSVTNSSGFMPSGDYFNKEVYSKNITSYKVVHKGMFAYNPSRINVGSIAWLNNMECVVVSPLYVVFKIDDSKLSHRYLNCFLHSDQGLDQIRNLTSGSVRDSLKYSALSRIQIPITSLSEQRKCADVFDKITTLISKRREQISLLDRLEKNVFIDMFGDIEAFEKKHLSDISEVIGGLTKNAAKRENYTLTLPYLRVANVQFNSFDLSELLTLNVHPNELDKGLLKKDDLLFVEGNGSIDQIGRVAIWDGSIDPCVHQNHLIKVRFQSDLIVPEYAMHYFMSPAGRKQIKENSVTTTGLNTLSVSKVGALILHIPPLGLQHKFAAIVKKCEKQKSRLQASLAELETTYKATLQKAYNGELF